ncbi:MAG: molybdenum cofactor biosynthesis protein B [Pseudomonadota bacterium]
MAIDHTKPFKPLRIAVLTLSDTRGLENDKSGSLLAERVETAGHILADRQICPDEPADIESQLKGWIDDPGIEVVITTGGTGVTGRDSTPEVFDKVGEKSIPGFGELFRMISFQKIGTSALQSRAVAIVANGTYLFALPGSTSACRDGWDEILQYQLDFRHRPCNFAELIPRLKES